MRGKAIGAGAAVALLAVGCGSAAKPLTEAEFVQQGNAICQQVNAQIERQFPGMISAMKRRDRVALTHVTHTMNAALDAGLSNLDDLKPPKPLRARYAHYLQIEKKLRSINRRRSRSRSAPTPAFHTYISNLSHEGANIREGLGLSNCNRY